MARSPFTQAQPSELRAKAEAGLDSYIPRIDEIERVTQHDVIAFTTAVAECVGPAARWLHFGLTSSDVLDTALALQRIVLGLFKKVVLATVLAFVLSESLRASIQVIWSSALRGTRSNVATVRLSCEANRCPTARFLAPPASRNPDNAWTSTGASEAIASTCISYSDSGLMTTSSTTGNRAARATVD